MIIDNLYLNSVFFLPDETNTPLVFNSDAVLTFSAAFQLFKSISRGTRKLLEETAALSTSSFILAALEILLNRLTGRSSIRFSVSLHLEDFIITGIYNELRHPLS